MIYIFMWWMNGEIKQHVKLNNVDRNTDEIYWHSTPLGLSLKTIHKFP